MDRVIYLDSLTFLHSGGRPDAVALRVLPAAGEAEGPLVDWAPHTEGRVTQLLDLSRVQGSSSMRTDG